MRYERRDLRYCVACGQTQEVFLHATYVECGKCGTRMYKFRTTFEKRDWGKK